MNQCSEQFMAGGKQLEELAGKEDKEEVLRDLQVEDVRDVVTR